MTYIVTFKQISGFIYTSDNNLPKLIYRPFGYLSLRLSLMTSIFLTLFCNQSETLSFIWKQFICQNPFTRIHP